MYGPTANVSISFLNSPMYILHVLVFLLFCTLEIYTHIALLYLSEIKPNLKKTVRGGKTV